MLAILAANPPKLLKLAWQAWHDHPLIHERLLANMLTRFVLQQIQQQVLLKPSLAINEFLQHGVVQTGSSISGNIHRRTDEFKTNQNPAGALHVASQLPLQSAIHS